jgi:CO dehydrogenase maturation factor
VEEGCDTILAVIDPSFESIKLAEKISKLGKQIGKPVYYVLNKVDPESKDILLKSLDGNRIVISLPNDNCIFKSGLEGRELDCDMGGIKKLADLVEMNFQV